MVPPPHKYAATPDELIEEMTFCGVAEGLVTTEAQRESSPVLANPRLVEETAARSCLRPAWVALPPQTRELGTPVELLAAMGTAGVRALWLFPKTGRYVFSGLTLGPLFETMIPRHVIFLVSLLEAEWGEIHDLMRDFPSLRLIVTDQSAWGQDRNFRPLLEKYEHVYLEVSRYEQAGGLEECCGLYGAHRFLFGTGYPKNHMAGPMLRVAQAGLPEKDRAAIAGKNLKRLLDEVQL